MAARLAVWTVPTQGHADGHATGRYDMMASSRIILFNRLSATSCIVVVLQPCSWEWSLLRFGSGISSFSIVPERKMTTQDAAWKAQRSIVYLTRHATECRGNEEEKEETVARQLAIITCLVK